MFLVDMDGLVEMPQQVERSNADVNNRHLFAISRQPGGVDEDITQSCLRRRRCKQHDQDQGPKNSRKPRHQFLRFYDRQLCF